MATVIWFDRKTGEILKIDEHPEWPPREIILNWYHDHPEETIPGAGMLTVPEDIQWDGIPTNWIVSRDDYGNPKLVKRTDWEAEQEVKLAEEEILLELAEQRLSGAAKRYACKRLEEVRKRLEGVRKRPKQ